jgi:CPA1 family monovalent cation:H+ antiporter
VSTFDLATACLVLTALAAYLNRRFLRLPTTIGVMAIGLALSIVLVALERAGFGEFATAAKAMLQSLDFSRLVMQGMLSLLLFASALHVDLSQLRTMRGPIAALAFVGTLLSAPIVGFAAWWLLPWAGLALSLPYCLAFGALISPTDPIAVMGVLKSAGAPKRVALAIAGESLFNDGVGIALFSLATAAIDSGVLPTAGQALHLVLRESIGGLAFGALLGWGGYALLRRIDGYHEEVLLTLAVVLGGYALASHLHVSGPLAMVVAGLVIGNPGRAEAMSNRTRAYVDAFWELSDAILNAVLFVLIGLGFVAIAHPGALALAAALAIVVVLLARALAVGVPSALLGRRFGLPARAGRVLTWGGLRGGISVALALSLPPGPARDQVVTLTYAVVVFSILVQGLTIGGLVRRTWPASAGAAAAD